MEDLFAMSLVAQMHAINARIEAMKAANAVAAAQGIRPQWVFADFNNEAITLDHIATDLRNRAG